MEIAEPVTIDEGVSPYGVKRELIIETDQVVEKLTYDAAPLLEAAHAERVFTAGQSWGNGQKIGVIPMAELDRINSTYASSDERKFQILLWLKNNPRMVTFEKFLK